MDRRYEELLTRGLYQFDKEALFELGVMCRDGVGVKQDTRGAEEWFVKAKMLGHPEAARALAVLRGETAVEEADPIIGNEEPPVIEEEPPVIEEEPPVLKRKKKAAPTEHPYCPHGHGQLRSWQGGMRCWTCGFVPGGTVTTRGSHVTIKKPDTKEISSGCLIGLIIAGIVVIRSCV